MRICDIDKLAEIICEIDYKRMDHEAIDAVKILIEPADEVISGMLEQQVFEIYQKDEKE